MLWPARRPSTSAPKLPCVLTQADRDGPCIVNGRLFRESGPPPCRWGPDRAAYALQCVCFLRPCVSVAARASGVVLASGPVPVLGLVRVFGPSQARCTPRQPALAKPHYSGYTFRFGFRSKRRSPSAAKPPGGMTAGRDARCVQPSGDCPAGDLDFKEGEGAVVAVR